MSVENQKNLISSPINVQNIAVFSPFSFHNLKQSIQRYHSIGWIHRPNYLYYEHFNKVPIYTGQPFLTSCSLSNNTIVHVWTKKANL